MEWYRTGGVQIILQLVLAGKTGRVVSGVGLRGVGNASVLTKAGGLQGGEGDAFERYQDGGI